MHPSSSICAPSNLDVSADSKQSGNDRGPKPQTRINMCGICGKLNFEKGVGVKPGLIRTMMDTIRHRGPDDEGLHIASEVGLGFRRLSIIDLSHGHQPLSNEDVTIWIVFNGEIYNYRELRSFLVSKGHVFETQTDTVVIVHLYEELGSQC